MAAQRSSTLAASQSDTDNTSASPASAVDKNALLLHCCCVIVQITPVAPGRSSYGASTASVKDAARKPVCICNTQCRLEALKQESAYKSALLLKKQQHGSLDRLLPPVPAQPEEPKQAAAGAERNYRLEKFYHQINGDLFEITRKVPIQPSEKTGVSAKQAASAASDGVADHHKPKQSHAAPLSRNRGLTKQQSQPQLQLRRGDAPDSRGAEKPQPPPRTSSRPKSTETDYINAPKRVHESLLIDTGGGAGGGGAEGFNRAQWQRHSARSMSGANDREKDAAEFGAGKPAIHQRHSSGPSELSILKSDISDLLMNLPKRQHANERGRDVQLSQALRDELLQILKRPLQRQHSGQSDLSSLKNDIVDWLKSQQPAPKAKPKEDEYAVPVPLAARKRHSFGHPEKAAAAASPDWIQCPINRIADLPADFKPDAKAEGRAERSSRMTERKLRHSASEVVTPMVDQSVAKHQPSRGKCERTHGAAHAKEERSRRSQTQRSATISDMSVGAMQRQHQKKSSSAERDFHQSQTPSQSQNQNASLVKCTDPMCPLIPICTDPNCCWNDCYNSKRYSSLPRCSETKCTPGCNYQNKSDAKCFCQTCYTNVKHNSLPKCMSSHRSSHPNFQAALPHGESRSSLPRASHSHRAARHHSGKVKLVKSVSAASLNSRRRRHKTVHFGENLLREVCQNRKLIEPLQKSPSEKSMQSNIQMLYNFVEGVLSAWVDEDDDTVRSGAESEPERGRPLKPLYRCNRLRLQTISRVVNEAAQLRGTLKLGNSRYRHRHWRGTAKECNERFLRKVIQTYVAYRNHSHAPSQK